MACPVNTSDNEEMKLFLKSDKYIYRNFKTYIRLGQKNCAQVYKYNFSINFST